MPIAKSKFDKMTSCTPTLPRLIGKKSWYCRCVSMRTAAYCFEKDIGMNDKISKSSGNT